MCLSRLLVSASHSGRHDTHHQDWNDDAAQTDIETEGLASHEANPYPWKRKRQTKNGGEQFFRRTDPKADPAVPALAWLEAVPDAVEAEIMATIDAVAQGPPPQFRGGLRYQVMHGDMTGWFEVRTKYRKRLYRLFCVQERKAPGLPRPAFVLITDGDKPDESAF